MYSQMMWYEINLPSNVEEFGVKSGGIQGVGKEVGGLVRVFNGASVLAMH